MSTKESEIFARIHIDTPSADASVMTADSSSADASAWSAAGPTAEALDAPGTAPGAQAAEPREEGFWKRLISAIRPIDKDARARLEPEAGQPYRMMPMQTVLDILKIKNDDEGYLDDSASEALRARLSRLGLATATTISGPLRLRCTDQVPIVDAREPQPSRYSSVTVCLYLIAWMLQADAATARDLGICDAWIDAFDPKAEWSGAAKGTLRWLLSRKLFLTAKRKQRTGRVKRYPNVRTKLLSALLQLVSDPETATAKRMKRLETIYMTLDLDPSEIHSDIHRMATTAAAPTAKRPADKKAAIDTEKLQAMAQSTQKAQQVLAHVFGQEQQAEAEPCKAEKQRLGPVSDVLSRLAEHDEWTRSEAEALAKEHGMTLGAMLERINDLAFEKADEAVADDGGDIIYIDTDIAQQCIK